MNAGCHIPAEQAVQSAQGRRRLSIGLPCGADVAEMRFPLTPEAVQSLVERGFSVRMERGAAAVIHYDDARYLSCGAEIVGRPEALGCDIVIHLSPLPRYDVAMLRRGAMLLTIADGKRYDTAAVKSLLDRSVITVALDRVKDARGHLPFADILSEVDGRAAIVAAASWLSGAAGKGVLLGGVTGIVPCEVTIFGSGTAAVSAAQSALGLGAQVRMFDNDVYSLREALNRLGAGVVGSVLHRHVVENALRSADVIISTPMRETYAVDSSMVGLMKKEVLVFDVTSAPADTFPSLPLADLCRGIPTEPYRRCLIHAGYTAPRTSAMALSNALVSMLREILTVEEVSNALKLSPGLQAGVLTFLGRPVCPAFAKAVGMRQLDLRLFIQMS